MRTIRISHEEFEDFRDVQIKSRTDWPATFSCNQWGEVWPFNTLGYTHQSERLMLEGKIPLLDEIVKIILSERPNGGRFFLRNSGVYVRPTDAHELIAKFVVT